MSEVNNFTRIIGDFVRVNSVIRDTLEYAITKPNYSKLFYDNRKKALEMTITQQSPLKVACDNNGEMGEKLFNALKDFFDTVYGEGSTIVTIRNEEVVVDSAQHLTILEKAIPLHEEINRMKIAHVEAAKKNQKWDDDILIKLVDAEEKYYRGFANTVLFNEFEKLFNEYNKARIEAKGAITPQSNFIQNDIGVVIRLFNLVRANAMVRSLDYYEFIDPLFALLECATGRRDLKEGQKFADLFKDVREKINDYLKATGPIFESTYNAFVKEMVEDSRKMQDKMAKEHGA